MVVKKMNMKQKKTRISSFDLNGKKKKDNHIQFDNIFKIYRLLVVMMVAMAAKKKNEKKNFFFELKQTDDTQANN